MINLNVGRGRSAGHFPKNSSGDFYSFDQLPNGDRLRALSIHASDDLQFMATKSISGSTDNATKVVIHGLSSSSSNPEMQISD